jgi:hypothetical protein
MYIYQNPRWPNFIWNKELVSEYNTVLTINKVGWLYW